MGRKLLCDAEPNGIAAPASWSSSAPRACISSRWLAGMAANKLKAPSPASPGSGGSLSGAWYTPAPTSSSPRCSSRSTPGCKATRGRPAPVDHIFSLSWRCSNSRHQGGSCAMTAGVSLLRTSWHTGNDREGAGLGDEDARQVQLGALHMERLLQQTDESCGQPTHPVASSVFAWADIA